MIRFSNLLQKQSRKGCKTAYISKSIRKVHYLGKDFRMLNRNYVAAGEVQRAGSVILKIKTLCRAVIQRAIALSDFDMEKNHNFFQQKTFPLGFRVQ